MLRLFLLVLTTLFTSLLSYASPLQVTYYVSDKSSAPIQSSQTDDGIITDVIRAITPNTVDINERVLPFKRMLLEMQSSKSPWVTYGSAAWPGPQSTSLSRTPVLEVSHVMLTKMGNGFATISELFGKSIVLIRGFDYPGLDTYIEQGKFYVMYVKDHYSAIQAVLKGRAVAFPEMAFRLQYHLQQMNVPPSSVEKTDISNIIQDYSINLCFSNAFPYEQRAQFEDNLKELRESGELSNIIRKYLSN